jgi:ferredoxin
MVTRARPRHDISALRQAAGMTDSIVSALGFGAGLVRIIETDDPDQLRAMLDAAPVGVATQKPAGFVPRGAKRSVLETTFRELHLAAPAPVDVVPLAAGAPFGGVKLNVEGCTLCHACVTACPTAALSDNPDRAMLRFTESLCVQCGLCQSTCPENVITLEPRLDFQAWNAPLRVLKEEEPFLCIACGKPFGTKSSIDRVLAKLGEKHGLPRRSRGEREFRPACGAAAPAGHDDRGLFARTRCEERRSARIVRSLSCPPFLQTRKRARARKRPVFPA